MEENKIEEMNKAVAEFMGAKRITRKFNTGNDYYVIDGENWDDWNLKYDSSWDWLMKVVEKIESIDNDFQVEISLVSCRIVQTSTLLAQDGLLIESHENTKIEAVYQAICEFIIWYNQNKKS